MVLGGLRLVLQIWLCPLSNVTKKRRAIYGKAVQE